MTRSACVSGVDAVMLGVDENDVNVEENPSSSDDIVGVGDVVVVPPLNHHWL